MPQYRCPLSGWIDAAVEQQVRRKRAEARLFEVEAERDKFHQLWKDACVRSGKNSLRVQPTPTAAELMALINEGEKE